MGYNTYCLDPPLYEISLSNRTKNVNNPNDTFPIEKCYNAILVAIYNSTNWTEICNMVAQDALEACKVGVNRAFKVTCAVYKQNYFRYHFTFKKTLGGYHEFNLQNQ